MLNCLAVALGGGIGACLRYLIGLIPLKEPYAFPVKTLVINLVGCFAIGLALLYIALSVVAGVGLAFAGQVVVGK